MFTMLMKKAYANEKWHICEPGTTKNAITMFFQCILMLVAMAVMLLAFGIVKLAAIPPTAAARASRVTAAVGN